MSPRRLLSILFPPPCGPLTRHRVMPLLIFLLLFMGICLILELRDAVLFTKMTPFIFLILAPWIWWMHVASHSGLTPLRSLIALALRFILLALFIVVLAEPRTVRTHDELVIIYTVDTSASVAQPAVDKALEYVLNTVANKPAEDEAGLVVFGHDAAVELPPDTTFPYDNIGINVEVDRDGTNLAKSLSLSAAMVPEDKQGRIVLISDGVETVGNLSGVLDDLKAKGIAVDVLHIDYDYEHEVWLERLVLPHFIKQGQTYETTVILSSLQRGEGRLVLQENGQVIFSDTVRFNRGKNRFAVPVYMRQPGYYEYTAHIELAHDKDTCVLNNKAISYLHLKGKGRVLLVTDPAGDDRDWKHIVTALRKADQEVEIISAYAFPRYSLALLPYDCIIFPNVPADAISAVQMQALHNSVYHQGSGFLMVGGQNSFGPGGYKGSAVEKVLPVSMDISQKNILSKGALAIILHTCEFPQGNEWAKRITKQAVKVLSSQDEVGALAHNYQGGEGWLFPLTPASQYQRLAKLINSAQIGDMPSFAPTMSMGLKALQASNATAKHMIIISDGDPQPPPPSLVSQFIASKISVTMVAVFPHGSQDISKMRTIALSTDGRYYYPQTADELPSIFIKEAKTIRRSVIQNKTFVPAIEFASPLIKGIDTFPPLHSYVLTMPKPSSISILRGPETDQPDPVLATWRYGVGATAAFTSDLSPKWGADWIQWRQYEAFVNQLIRGISRPRQTGKLLVRSFPAAGEGVILVEDYSPQEAFLEVQAHVEGPRDASHTLDLKQAGPRRYEGRFPLSGEGRYQIAAIAVSGIKPDTPPNNKPQRAHCGFVVPYSQEFLRFKSNPIVLDRIRQKTDGRLLHGNETGKQIYDTQRQSRKSSLPIGDWLLALMACLIPADVALRRVQLDLGVIKSWLGMGRAAQPSEATFSALLARKKNLDAILERKKETESAAPLLINKAALRRVAAAAPHPKVAEAPAPKSEPESTMKRLLAAKHRATRSDNDAKNI